MTDTNHGTDLPAAFWKQTEPLSLLDRMLLFQLRSQMSQEDRDLTHPHVILLFTADQLGARHTAEGRATLLDKVERAEDAEAQRGRSGHWAYDPSRHERLERLVASLSSSSEAVGQKEDVTKPVVNEDMEETKELVA